MTLSTAEADRILREKFPQRREAVAFPEIVTICGGGNGAHVAAGYLASKGVKVHVLTRQPDKWQTHIDISTAGSSWQAKGLLRGEISCITSDPRTAVAPASIVIIAAPANAHLQLLRKIKPFLKQGCKVGTLFGQGGFDWAARNALGNALETSCGYLFGLQNIPWICKTTEYGKRARIIGPKKRLYVACYPTEKKFEAAELMETLFDIPCDSVANFLNLTLTPSNQIIHPARYYGIFRDWDGKRTYDKNELEKRNGLTLCTLTYSRPVTLISHYIPYPKLSVTYEQIYQLYIAYLVFLTQKFVASRFYWLINNTFVSAHYNTIAYRGGLMTNSGGL